MKKIITKAMKRHKKLIEGNAALLVIDIQGKSMNYLRNQDMAGLPLEGYLNIIPHAKTVIDACRKAGIPVIYTQEWHRSTLADFGRETDGSEGIHLLENSEEVDIVEEVKPLPGECVVRKTRYDCFLGTGIEACLNGLGVIPGDTLIIIGSLTNVCIHYSAAGAHQRDYHIRVVEECVAGSSMAAHEAALEQIDYLQTGGRANLSDIIEAIAEYKPIRPQESGRFSSLR